jgi:hypothetical protein
VVREVPLFKKLANYDLKWRCFMSEQEIKELFSDKAYVSSLLALDTAEEVQASLAEKGIELSTTEISTLLDSLQKYSESDEELSEAALETVTGGLLISLLLVLLGAAVAATGTSMSIRRRRW